MTTNDQHVNKRVLLESIYNHVPHLIGRFCSTKDVIGNKHAAYIIERCEWMIDRPCYWNLNDDMILLDILFWDLYVSIRSARTTWHPFKSWYWRRHIDTVSLVMGSGSCSRLAQCANSTRFLATASRTKWWAVRRALHVGVRYPYPSST